MNYSKESNVIITINDIKPKNFSTPTANPSIIKGNANDRIKAIYSTKK